jgi:hypothetical protein
MAEAWAAIGMLVLTAIAGTWVVTTVLKIPLW